MTQLTRRQMSALLLTLPLAARAQSASLRTVTVAKGLQHPWGLAFLPDGRMLVTERPGRLRIVTPQGTVGPAVQGVPAVDARGQGGLLDVALDPQFADNGWVYLSYAEAGDGGNGTAVARGRLQGHRLTDVAVIFRQQPKHGSSAHFGSRLVFDRGGRLFVTLGDRFSRRDDAQDLSNHIGKIVRIAPDGSVPPDNPFVGRPGVRPEIWSYGHRNVQGAALHPETGELWAHEHGPQGGDELNVVEAGRNYGWPVITYGREYGTGFRIGEGTAKEGMEQPLTYWVPSIAPSGMAFLTSERYPGWRGNLFIGALRAEVLVRLELDGRRVVRQARLLTTLNERIRHVVQGPDGWLYILTDNVDGKVLRLER
ncbi:PQQ-dependent sugar dehydrogenase [Caldimonas thermodepolymerans]|uniref:Glucose/arabinose dehydrogenase n=1 Tax=Caldimonas thermodepolymerans TaxID=215580 RepID=A0AA46DD21_9BURK|nr:PQQ-dependent sugar dehydrogenase [Caldimonas thermodepolymerans]TCP06699.1 glucose/arabinose dehydrogenase [Caldimonas thermodepolymerans]UZG45493.1 PQQ-dependent sugar dehydrogenase [Caldimonas thermodepolymerans]UZG49248.1 PQQ-dependent sugar dehydrogenase [Caldimonas thermodepolymerans]